MVQDIANLVPLLAEKGGTYNVCSDNQPSFRDLELLIAQQLNKRPPLNIPMWLAKILALTGDFLGEKAPINFVKLEKITQSYILSNQKIKGALDWQPLNIIENFKIQ